MRQAIEAAQLGVRERLSRAKLHLDVHIAKDAATVMADSNRLVQVLYNLLSNAIGFSPEDGHHHPFLPQREEWRRDQRAGHGPRHPGRGAGHVFDRFESRSKGSRHRGRGPRPLACEKYCAASQGPRRLRSTPGAGTTVTVTPAPPPPRLAAKAGGRPGEFSRERLRAIVSCGAKDQWHFIVAEITRRRLATAPRCSRRSGWLFELYRERRQHKSWREAQLRSRKETCNCRPD